MKRLQLAVLVVVLLLAGGGCDPGFDYEPTDLARVDKDEWAVRLDGVEIRTNSLGGLVGSCCIVPEFEVINETSDLVAIEGAQLVTADQTYPVDLPGHGELRWRSAAPGASTIVPLYWEFDEMAVKLLGDRLRIILDLRIGGTERHLEIDYERVN